ncbi:MAG TPA: rhamnulokinase family protein [Bryobacteraceae bacterium]|nr:rhamnulokinase family protein [Bryobacteraceae bacterium]
MVHAALAIDLGATSGRAILGSLADGKLRLQEVHRFPNDPVAYNGELHWDAPRLWREVQDGLYAAARLGPISTIGVDAWGVDYALLGENGVLLENPYHYRDARTAGMVEKASAAVGADRIYDATGTQILAINTLYQVYAAAQRTPRLLAAAESLLSIPDLMNFWLCGARVCEYTEASTTQCLDRRTRGWAADLLRDLGIPTHFLKPIVQPGAALGPLRAELARREELKRTLVIAPACHDTGSAVAAVRTGGDTAFLSSGTWSLLGAEVPAPIVSAESRRFNFTNEGGVGGTCRLLKNITGLWLLEEARRQWPAPLSHEDLCAMASGAASSALFDPDHPSFTKPDNMLHAIDAYCARTGQPAPAEIGAYARAIFESLALKYRLVIEQLGGVTGTPIRRIRVIGGGCRNALLNQFTADATGCPVLAGPAEATALGNIAMQLVGAGAVASIGHARDLIEQSFPFQIYQPQPGRSWDAAYGKFKTLCQ